MPDTFDFGRERKTGAALVQVRNYTRVVNGRQVSVGAHTRSDPPGGETTEQRFERPAAAEQPRAEDRPAILAARRDGCEEQRIRDEAICRILQFRSCWASANDRHAQCLRGRAFHLS